jgi:hypothetical protein
MVKEGWSSFKQEINNVLIEDSCGLKSEGEKGGRKEGGQVLYAWEVRAVPWHAIPSQASERQNNELTAHGTTRILVTVRGGSLLRLWKR